MPPASTKPGRSSRPAPLGPAICRDPFDDGPAEPADQRQAARGALGHVSVDGGKVPCRTLAPRIMRTGHSDCARYRPPRRSSVGGAVTLWPTSRSKTDVVTPRRPRQRRYRPRPAPTGPGHWPIRSTGREACPVSPCVLMPPPVGRTTGRPFQNCGEVGAHPRNDA